MIGTSIRELDFEEISVVRVLVILAGGRVVVSLEEDSAEGRMVADRDVVLWTLVGNVACGSPAETFDAGIVPFAMTRD